MRIGRALAIGLVTAATPFLLLQGLSNSRISPGPLSWNGFWEADVARSLIEAEEEGGQLKISVNDLGRELAIDAITKEPFATNALFVMAVDYRSEGRSVESGEIIARGVELDKRSRLLGIYELEQVARERDLDQAFAIIDRLTMTNPQLVADFVRPLTSVLDEESSLPILRDALNSEPRWAEAFWTSIPDSESGLMSMLSLRQETAVGSSAESDALLLSALVNSGRYSEAFAFLDTLGVLADAGEIAFTNSTEYEPIGWSTTVSGERTFSLTRNGEFDVFVDEQTFGELARQLVRLQAGRYQFAGEVTPAREASHLEVVLRCAETESSVAEPQSLDRPAQWTVDGACSIYWLVLNGSAWERRSSLQAEISEMTFRRLP